MDTFATVDDLRDRWSGLRTADEARASVLLQDATAYIVAEYGRAGKDVPTDEATRAILKATCCAMVRRVLPFSETGGGEVSQESITAGSFTQALTYADPTGALRMSREERAMLGLPLRICKAGFLGVHADA